MYDLKGGSDDGREWIEVYNAGSEAVDLSNYKFFEADTNHKLTLVQGDKNLAAQGYAIIVSDPTKFKTDWPNNFSTIFDSTFSLSNTGESLALTDGDSVVDEYFYHSSVGGAGDGKSLQKINGSWLAASPTPGTENKIAFVPSPAPELLPKSNLIPKTNSTLATTPPSSPANASEDKSAPLLTSEKKNSYIFVIIFALFLGVGALAVYFIRRRKPVPVPGADFEILDS
jgi:hypothetical protein